MRHKSKYIICNWFAISNHNAIDFMSLRILIVTAKQIAENHELVKCTGEDQLLQIVILAQCCLELF